MRKPVVALVGRPNVGKSSLFNRLVEMRKAVVSDVPGTTRDRIMDEADWNGAVFDVVDTGGLEIYQPRPANQPNDDSPLEYGSRFFTREIRNQAMVAIDESDVIVLVVDVLSGITAADEEVAEVLRRTSKPVLIAANKADNAERRTDALEFYGLGMGEVFPVSALHGTGTGDLLDAIVEALPFRTEEEYDEDDGTLKIAIVGRPNVGKSSLLNKLLGQDRAIVSPVAGTTRDAVDTGLIWNGMPITLIDTAGIRRRGKVEPGIEKYAVLRAQKTIERADVVLLLIDAVEGITAQDLHIAGMVREEFKSTVVIVNKWDAIEKDTHTMSDYQAQVRQALDFMPYVPVLFISALTGQRIHQVLETAVTVQEERLVRIPTSALNKIIREAMLRHAPHTKQPRPLKIFLAQQVRVDPPTILLHVNDRRLLHFTYERYLENQIRREYPFTGTPIRFSIRQRTRKDKD